MCESEQVKQSPDPVSVAGVGRNDRKKEDKERSEACLLVTKRCERDTRCAWRSGMAVTVAGEGLCEKAACRVRKSQSCQELGR